MQSENLSWGIWILRVVDVHHVDKPEGFLQNESVLECKYGTKEAGTFAKELVTENCKSIHALWISPPFQATAAEMNSEVEEK